MFWINDMEMKRAYKPTVSFLPPFLEERGEFFSSFFFFFVFFFLLLGGAEVVVFIHMGTFTRLIHQLLCKYWHAEGYLCMCILL